MDSKQFRQHQEHWERAVISYKDDKGKSFGSTVLRVAVALKLYEHASDDGDQCMMYARRTTIAKAAGFNGSVQTQQREVSRRLRELENAGFIELVRKAQRPSLGNPGGVAARWKLVIPPAELDRVVHMWDTESVLESNTVTSNDGKNDAGSTSSVLESNTISVLESNTESVSETHTQYSLTTHPDQYTQTDHAQSENLARNDDQSGNDPHAQNISFEQRSPSSFSQTDEQPELTGIDGFWEMEEERREVWEDHYSVIAPGSMLETISYRDAVETFSQHFFSARRRNWDRPFMAYLNSLAADGTDLADGDMSELANAVHGLLQTIPKSQFYDERHRVEPDSDNGQQPEQTSDYRPF